MRVLLVNGSSRKTSCTNVALCEVERALNEKGNGMEQIVKSLLSTPKGDACFWWMLCKKNGVYDEMKTLLEEITPEVLQIADICNIIKCNPRVPDWEEIYQILIECL